MTDEKKEFVSDHRETNPGLHLLYVKSAVRHLIIIDESIRRLNDTSNLNMLDPVLALAAERKKLVDENAAYADADEIVQSIKNELKLTTD